VIDTSNLVLVPVKVTVAVPVQLASASVIGGFSFAALSSALNVFAGVGDGVGEGDGDGVGLGLGAAAVPPQAATRMLAAAMAANTRMRKPPWRFTSYTGGPARRMKEETEQVPKPDSVEDGHPSRAEVAFRL
jgi:hypothetical protein